MLDGPRPLSPRRDSSTSLNSFAIFPSRGIYFSTSPPAPGTPCVADIVSVLRNGRSPARSASGESFSFNARRSDVRADRQNRSPNGFPAQPAVALEVRSLTRRGAFSDVSFTLQQGEILGLAGMSGAGRTELLRSIFGADPPDSGEVVIGGTPVRPSSPGAMKRLGIALTPENRKAEGLIQSASTRFNMCIASLDRLTTGGFLTRESDGPSSVQS